MNSITVHLNKVTPDVTCSHNCVPQKNALNAEKLGGKVQPANASQMQTECHLSLSYLIIEPASTHIANDVMRVKLDESDN